MPDKKILILILLLFSSFGAFSQLRTETVTFEYDGYERLYKFFVPDNYYKNKVYPLIFVLHGGGGTARGIIRSTRARFNQLANQYEFITVYPQGYGKGWNDGARDTFGVARNLNIDDVGFIEKVIDDLNTKVNVDHKNIFVCGISNGGFMSQRLAFELSDKIRGIGVLAANLSVVQSKKEYPENPVPAIFINGTDDPLVPYEGGTVTVLRQKRGLILSVDKTIEIWREINHCSYTAEETKIPDINTRDNCTAIKTVYENPEHSDQKVVAIKVEGGGHTWPGTKQYLPKRLVGNLCRDFNGCDEIWNFFQSLIN